MAKRRLRPEEVHQKPIRARVAAYSRIGYTYIKGFPVGHSDGEPSQIGNHIPDLSVRRNGLFVVAKAETEDSLNLLRRGSSG